MTKYLFIDGNYLLQELAGYSHDRIGGENISST